MAIEHAFAAYIKTRPPISGLVGNRIYAERSAQIKDPIAYLVYELSGGENFMHSRGASGLTLTTIQVTCHGPTSEKARELFDVLEDELNGFRGMWGTTEVDRCELSQPVSATANATQGTQLGYPAFRTVLSVHYFKAIPKLGQP
jgi:hypothetical protein